VKTLLLNPPKYWKGVYICREEYGMGTVVTDFLPSHIYLATAYLRERGRDVDALDAKRSENVSFDNYDVVVVWVCILYSFYEDIKWLKRAKEEGKKTIMILNEAHETFEMEAMQRYVSIDASVRLWEREIVLDKLLSKWEGNEYPDFPGVIYRKDGQLIDTGRMPFLPNLEHLGSCSRILEEVPLENYKWAVITPSRGCPKPHSLCMYRRSGPRRRKVQDVLSELEIISKSISKIWIMDPAMVDDAGWLSEFCDQLVAKGIKVSWKTDARLEHCLDPEILRKLRRAGCHDIMFYTPTLDAEIGEKIGQSTTSDELKAAVENIRKVGIIPMPLFDIGFPWDSNETLSKIMAFLRDVPLPSVIIRQSRPWKGTPLYEECKALGLLKRELGIDDYVNSSYPILDTLYLSREEIEEWKNKIFRSRVLNRKYIWRFLLERKRIKARHFSQFLRLLLGKEALWGKSLEASAGK
jgi:radical SAM superfamily enzyme YgiQ (UPF0313 family)